jgi:hypothetical protein
MSEQKPSVGRVVHYVSHGTPVRTDGTQAYTKQCRAAVITELSYYDPELTKPTYEVGLAVLNPTGLFFRPLAEGGCEFDDAAHAAGTWHWPERV